MMMYVVFWGWSIVVSAGPLFMAIFICIVGGCMVCGDGGWLWGATCLGLQCWFVIGSW